MNGCQLRSHRFKPPSRVSRTRVIPRLCAIAVLSLTASVSAQVLDPFYERLYQDAVRAYKLEQYAGAAKDLRLACFGMLEETNRLGDCLAHLALAEAESGQEEAFLDTVARLMDVEQRFRGYTDSPLPDLERRRLETWLENLAPLESYAGVPAFKAIADRRQVQRIGQKPAAEREQDLDRMIAQDPRNPVWRALRGELLLEQGRHVEAAEVADRLMLNHPTHPGVACLRGRAQAGIGACNPETLADLARCEAPEVSETALEASVRCHVRNQDWDAATAGLAAMSEEQRQRRPIRALAKQARRGMKDRGPEPPVVDAEMEPEQAPAPVVLPATSDTSGPGQTEREVLASGWQVLRSDARDRFEDTYDSVRSLANRHAQWTDAQHLAAELAYRLSLWEDAVSYFRRAEQIVSQKPNLQFYLAVALYKSGDREAAADMLDQCVPHIQSSDFVQFWVSRIRADAE